MDPALLTLPWVTLLTLATGYMGYFIAHVGIRDHHKPIDVTFSTLVFGFCAAFSYQLMQHAGFQMLSSSAGAVITSIAFGAIWRAVFRPLFYKLMRDTNISYTDDIPSAWLNLFNVTNITASQLTVRLKDGRILMCSDLNRFRNEPNGPFVFGSTGDILMYVTHQKVGYAWSEADDVNWEEWGSEITYIPASEITQVQFRRSRKKSTF